jgi:putative transposase
MRKSKFIESQIVGIFAESDARRAVAKICKKHSMSNGLYYEWKSKYPGVSVNEHKRVRELESESSKLKKIYTERTFENTAIKDVLSLRSFGCRFIQQNTF